MRCKFFKPCVPGWLWNYFDTLVVAAQIVEIGLDILANRVDLPMSNLRLLRVLRVLRLVRILRVLRVLRLISELRAIVSSIAGSFKSLIWVVILLLLLIYIVACYFTQTVTTYVVEKKVHDEPINDFDENLLEMFSSMPRAILSLWQCISGGMDWESLSSPLFVVEPLCGLAFTAFVAFCLLALMNVVTGVFVQTALQSAKHEEDNFMRDQIVTLFQRTAIDAEDTIDVEEISVTLEDPTVAKEWQAIGVGPDDARFLFKLLDIEGSGKVPFADFLGGCLRLHSAASSLDMLTVIQESRKRSALWDLQFQEIRHALAALGVDDSGVKRGLLSNRQG